jgi:hypothetical protein
MLLTEDWVMQIQFRLCMSIKPKSCQIRCKLLINTNFLNYLVFSIFDSNFRANQNHYSAQIYYTVNFNGQPIDRGFTFSYNYSLILKTFSQISTDIFLCNEPVFRIIDSFLILSNRRLCDIEIIQ